MVNAQNSAHVISETAWELTGYMMGHEEEYLKAVNIIPPSKKLMNSETFQKHALL